MVTFFVHIFSFTSLHEVFCHVNVYIGEMFIRRLLCALQSIVEFDVPSIPWHPVLSNVNEFIRHMLADPKMHFVVQSSLLPIIKYSSRPQQRAE